MRHTISVLLENEAGALSRVAGLFSARGYNIESLTVAPTEDPTVSRMTLVTRGSEEVVEQITKQLNKLIDVIRLVDLSPNAHIERELILVKLRRADEDAKPLPLEDFNAHVLDDTEDTIVVEMIGGTSRVDEFLAAIDPERIIEVIRSGVLGILRGHRALQA
ncbi:MAG: acetolactate synthase small subunit [Gammaproteobacteria bacterium]|nr:acetolactate synthase small subunit [Gammaproteobacteria bacterium]